MNIKKKFGILISAFMMVFLCGCASNNGELYTYIYTHFPSNAEEFAKDKDGFNDKYVNDDGSVTVVLTKS